MIDEGRVESLILGVVLRGTDRTLHWKLAWISDDRREILIDALLHISQMVVFSEQCAVFMLEIEHLMEYFSMFVSENSHFCVDFDVLIGQAIDHGHKSLNLILLLSLIGQKQIYLVLHPVEICGKLSDRHGLIRLLLKLLANIGERWFLRSRSLSTAWSLWDSVHDLFNWTWLGNL